MTGTFDRFNRNRQHIRVSFLNDLGNTSYGSTGSNTSDKTIDLTFRCGPNFFGSGFPVHFGFAGLLNCCGMKALSPCSSINWDALPIAPPIPFGPGVSTISAPNKRNKTLLSLDIVSGIVRMQRYPFAAQTKAKAIPVFPEVGSMTTLSAYQVSVSLCSLNHGSTNTIFNACQGD